MFTQFKISLKLSGKKVINIFISNTYSHFFYFEEASSKILTILLDISLIESDGWISK